MSGHLAAMMNATLRVLIVEDDSRYRTLLVTMLRDLGCDPAPVDSATEAMRWLSNHSADVILLDLNMPGLGGLEFLDRFRQQHAGTPVIILTGVGTLQAAQAAIRHRVTDFLTKPCHLGSIEAALNRARRELAQAPSQDQSSIGGEPELSGRNHEARTMMEIERDAILAAIARHDGNRSAAATELGISRRTLHYRLAEYRRIGLLRDELP